MSDTFIDNLVKKVVKYDKINKKYNFYQKLSKLCLIGKLFEKKFEHYSKKKYIQKHLLKNQYRSKIMKFRKMPGCNEYQAIYL